MFQKGFSVTMGVIAAIAFVIALLATSSFVEDNFGVVAKAVVWIIGVTIIMILISEEKE